MTAEARRAPATECHREAPRRGAIASLIIHRQDLPAESWQVVRNSWGNTYVYLEKGGTTKLPAA
jgi:hypothetical protein